MSAEFRTQEREVGRDCQRKKETAKVESSTPA
jgi:hypothetical protein